jgi:hypothetical protein
MPIITTSSIITIYSINYTVLNILITENTRHSGTLGTLVVASKITEFIDNVKIIINRLSNEGVMRHPLGAIDMYFNTIQCVQIRHSLWHFWINNLHFALTITSPIVRKFIGDTPLNYIQSKMVSISAINLKQTQCCPHGWTYITIYIYII